jgi:3-phosphoshikimate 1-carboxyvinyltransferase
MLHVLPASGPLKGVLRVPGDKSISHRALIFSALAQGQSTITGLLLGDDVLATRAALEQMGAVFTDKDGLVLVDGLGMDGLKAPEQPLDMGNSGTAMRLLCGVLAAQNFDSELFGDASLSQRPMARIFRPLRQMGAKIEGSASDTPPVRIRGTKLTGINYDSPVASAQVKSCVLLAGLYASDRTCVSEPHLSRDHSERMLAAFGVEMPTACTVEGGSRLRASRVRIPADISSAAFVLAAAALLEDSEVSLSNVGVNPSRDGFIRAIAAMGADVELLNEQLISAEPVADIRLRFNGPLKGIDLPEDWVPSMVDEIPVLMVLAALSEGTTRIRGASELRVKESDRLQVMGDGLRKLGVPVVDYPDGVDITGIGSVAGDVLESAGDHRCAMSFAVLGLRSDDGLAIRDAQYISTSYPGFIQDMNSLANDLIMDDSR